MSDYTLDDLSYEEAIQLKASLETLGLEADLSEHGLTLHLPDHNSDQITELINQCPVTPERIGELANWLAQLMELMKDGN